MFRPPALIAAIAACGLLAGSAIWVRASLASAFSRGEVYGRALAAAQAGEALSAQRAALDDARSAAGRAAAALDIEKDALREKIDDLEQRIASGPGGAGEPAACLDAGLVRALDAIRRGSGGAGAP